MSDGIQKYMGVIAKGLFSILAPLLIWVLQEFSDGVQEIRAELQELHVAVGVLSTEIANLKEEDKKLVRQK